MASTGTSIHSLQASALTFCQKWRWDFIPRNMADGRHILHVGYVPLRDVAVELRSSQDRANKLFISLARCWQIKTFCKFRFLIVIDCFRLNWRTSKHRKLSKVQTAWARTSTSVFMQFSSVADLIQRTDSQAFVAVSVLFQVQFWMFLCTDKVKKYQIDCLQKIITFACWFANDWGLCRFRRSTRRGLWTDFIGSSVFERMKPSCTPGYMNLYYPPGLYF